MGRHHFAFLRAVVNGIGLDQAWQRYLAFAGGSEDSRRFASRLRQLVEAIEQLGPARGLPEPAATAGRLLRRLPAWADRTPAPPDSEARAGAQGEARSGPQGEAQQPVAGESPATGLAPSAMPSLQQWISERCDEGGFDADFYAQAEWLAQYREAFGRPPPGGLADRAWGDAPTSPAGLPSTAASGIDRARVRSALSDADDADAAHRTPVGDMGVDEEGAEEGACVRAGEAQSRHLARRGAEPRTASAAAGGTGPARRARRAPGGAERQAALAALALLEPALARTPQLDDPIAHWLSSGLERGLVSVGVISLRDLVQWINLQGFRWHRRVPRLGRVRAARLVAWLAPIAQAGGLPLRDTALRPDSDSAELARRQSPAPLPPTGPDGQVGQDIQGTALPGLAQWLSRLHGQTRQDHARIAARFLRWCRQQRRPPQALDEADWRAYQAFLANPPADWIQARPLPQGHPDWRPFRGPLAPQSQRRELAVISSLLASMPGGAAWPMAPSARGRPAAVADGTSVSAAGAPMSVSVPMLGLPAPRCDASRSLTMRSGASPGRC